MCSIAHCYVDWASYCVSAQWYSQICRRVCAGQRWDQGWSEEVEVGKSGEKLALHIEIINLFIQQTFPQQCRKNSFSFQVQWDYWRWVFPIFTTSKRDSSQRKKKKKSLRSNNEFTINLRAKNMLWSVCAHSSCRDVSFITEVAVLQPCPCYCTLSCCWLNKLHLDVWGPTPAINVFTFN